MSEKDGGSGRCSDGPGIPHRSSPKHIPPPSSQPPIVTIAPTHALSLLPKPHDSLETNPNTSEALRGSTLGEDLLVRGFQPYRAPDLTPTTAGGAQAGLRPPLAPLDISSSYSPYHPSLYPHPLSHPGYRLVPFCLKYGT